MEYVGMTEIEKEREVKESKEFAKIPEVKEYLEAINSLPQAIYFTNMSSIEHAPKFGYKLLTKIGGKLKICGEQFGLGGYIIRKTDKKAIGKLQVKRTRKISTTEKYLNTPVKYPSMKKK